MRAILARSLLSCVLLAVPATAQTFSVGPGGDFPGVATALASPLVGDGGRAWEQFPARRRPGS